MPILTEDPRRLTHPHNLPFPAHISPTPTRVPPTPTRVPPRIDTWRGRKRPRSPSTSPVGSPERTWRTWNGVQALEGMDVGDMVAGDGMGGFDQEQQQRRSGGSGNEGYAVRSGVQLVLPTPEELAHQSPRTLDGTDANTIITIHRQSFSKRKASIASTSSVYQDPQTHADAPKIKRPRSKGSYKHASSAGDFTSDASVAVSNQEVPVWDINTSAGRSSEGEEGGSARLSIGKDGYTVLEEHHGGDVSDDQENGYYVTSNMLLHDLHLQRRTRRPFTYQSNEEYKKMGDETTHQQQHLQSPKSSPSTSSASGLPISPTSSSTRSDGSYRDNAALLVAGDTGANMTLHDINIHDGERTSDRQGRALVSGPRRHATCYVSDEEDETGLGVGQATTATATGCLAGYEDMNRLLGRLVIQRRGCRRG